MAQPTLHESTATIDHSVVTCRIVVAEGVHVFYREAGSRDLPHLLLLHGFPSSSHMFRDLIGRLATDYHVVAPDLPGFGFTAVPDGLDYEYTFDHLARTMAAFTSAVALDRYALYVFDYGAPVGFRMAVASPDRITAIVSQNGNAYVEGLSEGWNPIQAYWASPTDANREALRGFFSLETTRWQYTHGVAEGTHVAPESWTLDAALMARPGNDDKQLDLFLDYASNVASYPTFQSYFREHRPPLLAVWGRNDPFFLPAGADAFRRDLPEAEVHFLETGHFALETHAATIATLMHDFLDRHVGARARPDRRAVGDRQTQVVRDFYDALGRGDVTAVLALLDPAVRWTEAERFPYYTGTWIGPQAVLDNLLKRLTEDWSDFSAKADDFITDGSRVVSFGTYAGTYKATGKSMTSPFAHLWTIREGKLASFRMYTDTAKVLEALAA